MSIACYRLSPWHPLSRFPGPVSARLTKWWMIYQIAVKGGRHVKLRELHAQYGPWVRVGPNEISVNLPCAVRPIYNKLDRSPFYSAIPADADTLITVLDRQVHASRRQAWTKAVTSDAMQSYIPFLMARITQLDRIFDRETSKGPVQIDHWINLFLMDLMGDMGFSGGFETMSAGKDTEGWMEMFAKKKVAEIKASTGNKTRRDILGTLLDESSAIYRLNEAEAAADAALIVVAATDTTAQTLAALVPYTMCDRNILSRLQAEVGTAFVSYSGESENMDVSAVMRLPFLDACIQEALRLVPPGPFGPPRTSGSVGVNISDVYIPPNTTIHVPVYTMHRDSANFGPNADDYAPERWLEGSICTINFEGKPKIIKEAFMPFSAGYASCVGKKLALQNMK
ncbi:cytochrome P450 [Gloeophyllum trabeum ATCC 11539]|uniref:Cytochrome P450 n=1 Tax=Gloeophyllum trabeum (strain ATCC 11539 / FP-39264 / Madison 617) TaxID=670483 RepID=S7PT97_GLOTA|nr:cytochrome P450 [Gloeophyllum trabeum ATCC 11539]EPQ50633.1 cytochrome P450 [Gloeophyllum trabeum ATCC 11539]